MDILDINVADYDISRSEKNINKQNNVVYFSRKKNLFT